MLSDKKIKQLAEARKHIQHKPLSDETKQIEIRWLCFKCHRQWHKEHDNPDLMKGGDGE